MFKQWIALALKIIINSHLYINTYQYAIAKTNFVFLKNKKYYKFLVVSIAFKAQSSG